jgi:ATP-binding cassette subfamily B multidrug efflux pump
MFQFFENLIDPYPETEVTPLQRGLVDFVWACTKGVRPYIAAMVALTAAIGVFEAMLFSVLGHLVDRLSVVPTTKLWAEQRSHLLLLAAVLLGSTLLIGMQSLLKQQTFAANFAMRLRWIFHRTMLAQSMSFYQDELAARVATKVMQTALAVRDTWMILIDVVVFITIYFSTTALVVGNFDLWLLAPFLSWLGLYLLAIAYCVPRLAKASVMQADARSLMTGRIADAYSNIATVKLFSHTKREIGYVRGAMTEFLRIVHLQMRMITRFEIINHALSMALIASAGGGSVWLWAHGKMEIGAVAASVAMALRLNGISRGIMWEAASLFDQIGTVQDGMTALTSRPTITDRPGAQALHLTGGEIRFEHVSFDYGGLESGSSPVIKDLNVHIHAGEKIGLVGRSGAGKSTIVNLLLRFYDLSHGRILIDNQDISHVTQDSLRAHIGMVIQDTSLLHRSIRDNIAYGRPDAVDEDVMAASKLSEAHEFVSSLTDVDGRRGYQVHVGDRGAKLSGGQRQRIAIARVMLKDARILLLDEATSALDSEVEAAIQHSFYRLMEGKTVIAIAHRLSTISAMDRLLVLDHGRIIEEGTHLSLLEQGGLYARLWALQSGGFLGVEAEGANLSPKTQSALG